MATRADVLTCCKRIVLHGAAQVVAVGEPLDADASNMTIAAGVGEPTSRQAVVPTPPHPCVAFLTPTSQHAQPSASPVTNMLLNAVLFYHSC
jgi:hypothetical protein